MPVRNHAPPNPQLLGRTLIHQHQHLPNVNMQTFSEDQNLKKQLVKLTILGHHALLIRAVPFTEQLCASKESNGSRLGIYQLLPQLGLLEQIIWQEPLKQESKGKMMLSGQFNLALSSSTPTCSRLATSRIGSSHLKNSSLLLAMEREPSLLLV